MTASTPILPSREVLRASGPRAYIVALANSFPCLAGRLADPNQFDVDKWMDGAGPWSHGEKLAATFIANVWNPGYAASQDWRFDLFEACGTWDTGNRRVFLNWAADPIWP